MTQQEKIQSLSKDFLDRDNVTFVKIRQSGRLGWERTLTQPGVYSEAFDKVLTQEDLIQRAYKNACQMITVMNCPFKVKVCVTDSMQNCTDSKDLFVSTKVFDETDLSVGQKLDVFLGLTVHEGCHLLYTDFDCTTTKKKGVRTIRALHNIIEDERIERLCGERTPGLANFLIAAKYYMFDLYYQQVAARGGYDNLPKLSQALNAIVSYIRYPKHLSEETLNTFADVLLSVKEVLTPYPQTTQETFTAAEKIYEVLEQYEEEQEKKEQEKKEQKKQKKQQKKQQKENGTGESQSSEDPDQESSSNEQQSSGGTGNSGTEESNGSQTGKSPANIDNALSDMLNDMQQNIAKNEQTSLDEKDKADAMKDNHSALCCQGDLERGKTFNSFFEKGKENIDVYRESYDRIKKYIPAVSKHLRMENTDHQFVLRGMKNGRFDTSKIAEAYQGCPNVYLRQGEVKTNKLTVCILVDESGSMWGANEVAARDAAILLNEALAKVPNLDLYIYGHTATHTTTTLYIYREKGFNVKYALGSTESRAGNHDSIAIQEAVARVRKHTSDRILFFMISDGAPNESTNLVKKAVEKVEKDNVNVVAISIDPYYDPSTMYKNNVTFSDLQRLSIDLGLMIRQAVKKNSVHSIQF